MSEHGSNLPTPTTPSETVVGLVAQFDGPEALLAAARRVREAGYRQWDTHSPFPVHGMDRAMGIRPTVLPWLVLGAGMAGALVALVFQWWANGFDYPIVASGKPLWALPANIPVTFELIVLLSALTAFGGVLVLNRLPQFWHPALTASRFVRATTDGFFISVEAADPKFDLVLTDYFLQSLGAQSVETCRYPAAGREVPPGIYWALVVVVLLCLLPPLWIARTRLVVSGTPRVRAFTDMALQPKYQEQQASPLFADGRAMRPQVPGTIALGQREADGRFYRGQEPDGTWTAAFPIAVDAQTMERGRERFGIYCAACHGLVGEGDGMVHQRAVKRGEPGWVPPLSLHVDTVVDQPNGRMFNTITHGIRKMPGYGVQIPPADRWAIVLYVRALQRSQYAELGDVPSEDRGKVQ
jgi:mono/diheme cytochrome c family protein